MLSRLKAGLIFSLLMAAATGLSAGQEARVEYTGVDLLDTGKLKADSYLTEAERFSDSLLSMELQRLDSLYFNIGHPGAVIQVDTAIRGEQYLVTIAVSEGSQAIFGKVSVTGKNPVEEEVGIYGLKSGQPFLPARVGEAMNSTLFSMNRAGYPYAQVWITGFDYDRDDNSVDISFSLVTGERMTASELIFEGISSTDTSTAMIASGFRKGREYDEKMLVSVRNRLEASGLFEEVLPGRVVRRNRVEVALVFPVEELKRRNLFRGAFGFSRKENDEYEVNGNVELQLNNIAGTGRAAEFNWINDGRSYSRTEISYLEPFLLSRNLSLETSLRQIVQDSLYNMSSGSLRFGAPFGPAGFRLSLSASADRIVIENEVDLNRSFRQRYGLGLEKKSGSYLRFESSLEGGLKKNYYKSRDDESIWQLLYNIEASSEIPTFRSQSVYLRLVSEGIFSGGEIHPAELFPVGGARSIRGYRENQFRSERASYLNLEYRLGRTSRVFFFNDTGILYREDTGWELKNGAGFGLRSVSAVGIIELSFGMAERFSLDAARIHVSLVESF